MCVRDVRSGLRTSPAVVNTRTVLFKRGVHTEPVLYLVYFSIRRLQLMRPLGNARFEGRVKPHTAIS